MTNTKLACIWRDGCNQFDVCQAAECCQAIRSNREKAKLPPSKERIHPCPHGHTPDLCRLCMRAEIERLDSALTSSRGETARACQEYREVLAENTKLKRAAHEPSQTSNEKVARLRALFDDRTKDFRRSHSEALFNEYARLERELETANRTIAHFLGPEGEKYIDRFAAMLAGPVSLDESLRRYSPPEPRADQCEVCTKPLPPVGVWSMPSCPDCQELLEGLGQIMADFADREQTIKADWIGRAINLICARPSQPPRVICGPELAHAMDKLGAIVNGQTERITPIEANALLTNWRQLQSDARTAQPPCELPEGFPAISDTSLRDLRDTTKSVLLQSALIELQMRRAAQPPVPVQETAWIIDYADVDRRPEHFSGFGAEQAARRRFDQAKVQWTCRLFRCVDDSGYGTGLTKEGSP